MIRWFDAALITMMVIAASITFWIKHDTRRVTPQRARCGACKPRRGALNIAHRVQACCRGI